MHRSLAAVLTALAFATPLSAQTESRDASITLTITASLNLATTSNIAFGSWAASTGTIATSSVNHARFDGSSDVGNSLSVSFVIPTGLTRVGGGGNGPVPFSCGASSAGFNDGIATQTFNPALGGVFNNSSGSFFLTLGNGANGGSTCSVTTTGRSPGDYQAVATVTVAVV